MPRSYYTLIGSLPNLPAHFEAAQRVPISSVRLDERLKMLDPADLDVIEQMADFLVWDRQPLDRTDEDVRRHFIEFMQRVKHRFARDLIEQRMRVRTVVSALRRRRLGLEPTPGPGPWLSHIRRNWKHPQFRLETRSPWIVQAEQLLGGDDPFDLERLLLNVIWDRCRRLAGEYQFSFEAVILYLIRWEIVFRWTNRDAAAGRQRFEQLVTEAMGDYAKLYE